VCHALLVLGVANEVDVKYVEDDSLDQSLTTLREPLAQGELREGVGGGGGDELVVGVICLWVRMFRCVCVCSRVCTSACECARGCCCTRA